MIYVVYMSNVGMAGPGHDLVLLQEAFEGNWVSSGRLDQLLDRDPAHETGLLSEVYRAHPPASELALDAVFAYVALARHRRRGRDHHRDRRRRSRRRRYGDQPHRRRDVRNIWNCGGRRAYRGRRG